jgi:hypothetical protein
MTASGSPDALVGARLLAGPARELGRDPRVAISGGADHLVRLDRSSSHASCG